MTENSTEKTPAPDSPKRRSSSVAGRGDRRVKTIFFVVIILAIGVVYYLQRDVHTAGDWRPDLTAALDDARDGGRKTVILFTNDPPGEVARRILDRVKVPSNQKALEQGKFVRVLVKIDSTDAPVAKQYDVAELPTLLLINPDGAEANRHVGDIGEVPFRTDFLQFTAE